MQQIQLARSEPGFELLDEWHARFEARLTFPRRTERVTTSSGHTDVLITGPAAAGAREDAIPVVVLHGAMAGAPFALGELADLPAERSLYGINIPGQSTRAAAVRLDFKNGEYGRWLAEVMNALGIERAILCAVSWGGSVALHAARDIPDRIAGLMLMVPGSIVRSPVLAGLFGLALPMLRYKLRPTKTNLRRAFRRLLTDPDDYWLDYLGDAVRHWRVDFTAPPLVSAKDVGSFTQPVYAIAADGDLSFPGPALLARAEKLFPNLVGTHLLQNSRHSPSNQPADRTAMAQLIAQALDRIARG